MNLSRFVVLVLMGVAILNAQQESCEFWFSLSAEDPTPITTQAVQISEIIELHAWISAYQPTWERIDGFTMPICFDTTYLEFIAAAWDTVNSSLQNYWTLGVNCPSGCGYSAINNGVMWYASLCIPQLGCNTPLPADGTPQHLGWVKFQVIAEPSDSILVIDTCTYPPSNPPLITDETGTQYCEPQWTPFKIYLASNVYTRGDANADGNVNVTDAVYMLTNLFPLPNFPCNRAADVNLDSTLNTADVVYFLDNLFPQPTFPPPDSCGINPADILSCDSFPSCGWPLESRITLGQRIEANIRLIFEEAQDREGFSVVPVYLETDTEIAAFQFKLSYEGKYEIWVENEGCVTEDYDYFTSYIGENTVMVASIVTLTPSTTGKSLEYMAPGKYKVAEIRVKGDKVPEFTPFEIVFSDVSGHEIIPKVFSGIQEKETSLPKVLSLFQNIPNPFREITEIRYTLPKDANVELVVYNASGQKVKTLVSGEETAGYKVVRWNGTDDSGRKLSPGVYFYCLRVENFESIQKLLLLR